MQVGYLSYNKKDITTKAIQMNETIIATATKDSLEKQTVTQLRKLATGQIAGYRTMKKGELVKALLDEGDRLRKFAESIDEARAAQQISAISLSLGEFMPAFFQRFKSAVESNLDVATGETKPDIFADVAGLSAALVSHLSSMAGNQNNGGLADSTKLKYKSDIMGALRANIQAEQGSFLKPALESAANILERALSQAFKEQYQARKTQYNQSIAARKESKTGIDIKPLIALAHNALVNLDTLKAKDWALVSVAIAIATGRRASEVHGIDTSFEVAGKDSLKFTGQLKAKGAAAGFYEQNPSYEIPSLVYPELVVAGHQWLRDNEKLESDPKKAHNRFSRYLSAQAKSVFQLVDSEGDKKKHTYKALRAIYAGAACARHQAANPASHDGEAYIALILGHGRQDLAAGRKISDWATGASYRSDWNISA